MEMETRERKKENKTIKNIKKILFKENEEWNRDCCWSVFKITSG
jgi:hypothetical protein